MHPGDPNQPQQQWGHQPAGNPPVPDDGATAMTTRSVPPGQPGHQSVPSAAFPQPGQVPGSQQPPSAQQPPGAQQPPSAQWGAQPGPGFGGQPQGWGAVPPNTSGFDLRAQLPVVLLVASTVAGLVTYFMGFVSWVAIDTNVSGQQLEQWGMGYQTGDTGIPGFASYEIVLNPGKFLILLGALAIAAGIALVPRFRRSVPLLAVLAVGGWLALFSAAITISTGPVLSVGAGAIVALIFGFLQAAFLVAAAVIGGLRQR